MRRHLFAVLALALPAAAALVAPAASAHVAADPGPTPPPAACAPVRPHAPAGTRVETVTAVAHAGGTISFPTAYPPVAPIADVPAWCDVTVTVSHLGANDHVKIKVSLPQDRSLWSGRFQAAGGSAYLAGDLTDPAPALVQAVKAGYAAGATDAGVGQSPVDVSGWALTQRGTVDTALLTNFSTRSLHDLAVVGKDVAKQFYGRSVTYAYWNGCSTGGRQGYAEAQAHPTDFQGVLANAPAISWDRFAIATLWSQAVFNEEHVQPSPCELQAFTDAAVKACDTLDGHKDGVIDDPSKCDWDARRLVGTKVVCDGHELTISRATADAVRKIWAGPTTPSGQRLWYGPNKGASLDALAASGTPFVVADQWARYFVTGDPSFDTTKLTYASFYRLFASSQRQFHDVIGTDDPDLRAFARSGGKLITWHGQADQLVPTQGTVDYKQRVDRMLGAKDVDTFYRVFLLPGVDHCAGGTDPTNALGSLVRWVEQGKAPATLTATTTQPDGTTVTRHVRPLATTRH
ncbi:tannase/feruloyl esterase family alpha/beta hydrolase [Luteimicrobium sp. NPDC057192]|uniref:tannase/feruloyl esterase family alpha/beta hydrolase n=1 Tax=Luteimicrobium sp. NPDC057192 TaxID=3346042 RepID=UPI003631614E